MQRRNYIGRAGREGGEMMVALPTPHPSNWKVVGSGFLCIRPNRKRVCEPFESHYCAQCQVDKPADRLARRRNNLSLNDD